MRLPRAMMSCVQTLSPMSMLPKSIIGSVSSIRIPSSTLVTQKTLRILLDLSLSCCLGLPVGRGASPYARLVRTNSESLRKLSESCRLQSFQTTGGDLRAARSTGEIRTGRRGRPIRSGHLQCLQNGQVTHDQPQHDAACLSATVNEEMLKSLRGHSSLSCRLAIHQECSSS